LGGEKFSDSVFTSPFEVTERLRSPLKSSLLEEKPLACRNESSNMDVRQYAFLARQPSAAVKTREHFWGMPKRGLAFLLANVMFWQPMWAQADGIVVANPNTSLDRAGMLEEPTFTPTKEKVHRDSRQAEAGKE